MKRIFLLAMMAIFVLNVSAQNPYEKFTRNLPFPMAQISAPTIPDRQVTLTDFGAVGDGETLCTEAFVKAIDA